MGFNFFKERCELAVSIVEKQDGFILKRDLQRILADKLNLRYTGASGIIMNMVRAGIIYHATRMNPMTKRSESFVYLSKDYIDIMKGLKWK